MSRRLALVLVLFALWSLLILARLVQLQLVDREAYAERAARQQQRLVAIQLPRGTVHDARGRILAISVQSDSLFADPAQVEDAHGTAEVLAPLLQQPAAELEELLSGAGRFIWLQRQVSPDVAERVAAAELADVHVTREYRRYYPMAASAGPVLGFAGVDGQGLEGLEAHLEDVLAGDPRGKRKQLVRDGRRETVHSFLPDVELGSDVYLTIDASIQFFAEQALREAVEEHQAESGSVVLLDPNSGAVLAMANYPDFDPNAFQGQKDAWRNRAITDAYEPGSTFKVVTAAAARARDTVDLDERIDCQMGSIRVRGARGTLLTIHDHRPFGWLSFREVMAHSSNIGMIKVAQQMEEADFYRTIRDFGFGERTGIDLGGEAVGSLAPVSSWTPDQSAYLSFGQGLSVTPLQMANAFAALANGGNLLRPYVVHRVAGEREPRGWRTVIRRVAPPRVVEELREVLELVVTDGGGKAAAIPGYRVAGKTGTGEIFDTELGAYSDWKRSASFAGFAPAGAPAVAGIVVLHAPRNGRYGGQVAAPVFARIVHRSLLYLGVPPDVSPATAWPGQQQVARHAVPPLPGTVLAGGVRARGAP